MTRKNKILLVCSLVVLGCWITTLSGKENEVGAASPAPLHGGSSPEQKNERIKQIYSELKEVNEQMRRVSARKIWLYEEARNLKFEDYRIESKLIFEEMKNLDEQKIKLTKELIEAINLVTRKYE